MTGSSFAQRLQGNVALITGGASGISETTAKLFARHGAKVVIADVQSELGQNVVDQIQSESGQTVSYIDCNVTNENDVKTAVDTVVSKHGKLDIMFNNAGVVGNTFDDIHQIEYGNIQSN